MRLKDGVTAASGLVALIIAVFAVGGVHRWAQACVAVSIAIGLTATAWSRRGFARVSPLVVVLGIAVALTTLQLIPLPAAVVASLSPSLHALREDGAQLVDADAWSTLTASPAATLNACILLLSLLGLAVLALRIAVTENGRYRILASVALVCAGVAVVTGVHELLGFDALYGWYEPLYARPLVLGPLLNVNTLGCVTAVGAVLGIGLAGYPKQRGWVRASWIAVTIACGAVTVSTLSRGATLAMIGGAIVTVALLIVQRLTVPERPRHRRGRFLTTALPLGTLAACLIVLVIYTNARGVERQLSTTSIDEVHDSRSKYVAWRSATRLIDEAPWVGIGRGSFESAFPRVHPASGMATYAYVENETLQAFVDWGIPGAVAIVLSLLWLASWTIPKWRDGALAAGALGALAIIAMHSNVDFGLEILGLAAPATLIAACLTYTPLREATRPVAGRLGRASLAGALVIGATLLASDATTPVDEDRRALAAHPTMDRVREAVVRHSLDYYSFAVAAELADKANDPRAVLLLNHALALNPTHPQLHRMAARMLLQRSNVSQAAIEYAAALRFTTKPAALLREIIARMPEEYLVAALPTDYANPKLLVTSLTDAKRPDIARAWLVRSLDLNPRSSRACELLFNVALNGDRRAAELASRRCSERLPDYQARVALAKLLVSYQAHADTIPLLQDVEHWQSRRHDKIDAWLLLCDSHQSLGYVEESKRCLRKLDASPDMLDERRAELLKRIETINAIRRSPPVGAPE